MTIVTFIGDPCDSTSSSSLILEKLPATPHFVCLASQTGILSVISSALETARNHSVNTKYHMFYVWKIKHQVLLRKSEALGVCLRDPGSKTKNGSRQVLQELDI